MYVIYVCILDGCMLDMAGSEHKMTEKFAHAQSALIRSHVVDVDQGNDSRATLTAMADTEQQPGEIEDIGAESQAETPESAAPNESSVGHDETKDITFDETEPKEKNSQFSESESVLPQRSRRSKVRTTVPTEGVELAIGQGELEGAEPVTFGQLFQRRVQEFPTVAALKWKEKVGGGEKAESEMPWKTATFAEYYKSCILAAKSLLKAR